MVRYQPYGKEGLIIADVDLDAATGTLAKRCRYTWFSRDGILC